MSLITLPGDAGHILRNRCESRLDANGGWRLYMASKKRDLLEVLRLELEFLKGGGYRKGVLMAPAVHFRGFSHLLELWRSGTQATLFRVCPDVSWCRGISRRKAPLPLHSAE